MTLPGIPPLEDILRHYQSKDLLAHPDDVRAIAARLHSLGTEFPNEELRRNVALLTVWPLIEAHKIAERSTRELISKQEIETKRALKEKFYKLRESEDRQVIQKKIFDCDEWDVNYLNPYLTTRNEFLRVILSDLNCEPLKAHIKSTNKSRSKIIHDSQMGGSIYLVGQDYLLPPRGNASYSFLQRSFICLDKDNKPLLFMDSIEGGEPHFGNIDHWRGFDEKKEKKIQESFIHHLYLALGGAMYVAELLDIETIIPRDFELVDFSRIIGLREKKVFAKEQIPWKIGVRSEKRRTGVYTHSLYRANTHNFDGTQVRHPVLPRPTYRTPADIQAGLERSASEVISLNKTRQKYPLRGTEQRVEAISLLYEIIENHPLCSEQRKKEARNTVLTVYSDMKRFGISLPDNILPTIYKQNP